MSKHDYLRLFARLGLCAESGMAAAADRRLFEAQDQAFNLPFCKANREKNKAFGEGGPDSRESELCVFAGD